jgi:hypothetical protein
MCFGGLGAPNRSIATRSETSASVNFDGFRPRSLAAWLHVRIMMPPLSFRPGEAVGGERAGGGGGVGGKMNLKLRSKGPHEYLISGGAAPSAPRSPPPRPPSLEGMRVWGGAASQPGGPLVGSHTLILRVIYCNAGMFARFCCMPALHKITQQHCFEFMFDGTFQSLFRSCAILSIFWLVSGVVIFWLVSGFRSCFALGTMTSSFA